jgi:hypothetical protein
LENDRQGGVGSDREEGGCNNDNNAPCLAFGGVGMPSAMPLPKGGEDDKEDARQRTPSWMEQHMVGTMDNRSMTEEDEAITALLGLCCGRH